MTVKSKAWEQAGGERGAGSGESGSRCAEDWDET